MRVEDFAPKQLNAELFIGRLRGGSQPILVQASDGYLYVVKFQDNPQGPNVPFNEALGSLLFEVCGLRVPSWAVIEVNDGFLDRHPESWFWTGKEYRRPQAGCCFGSRFQGMGETPVVEILSRSQMSRVSGREDFWRAWFLDILTEHCDHRQALFARQENGALEPIFFDHGHLFGGPLGEVAPKVLASRYLDSRIYEELDVEGCNRIAHIIESLHQENLLRLVASLPQEWATASAMRQLQRLLARLNDGALLENISDYLRNSCYQFTGELSGSRKTVRSERLAGAVVPACLPGIRYA